MNPWDNIVRYMPERASEAMLRRVTVTLLEPPSDMVLQFWPEVWPVKEQEQ
jgi:hypothetical protein